MAQTQQTMRQPVQGQRTRPVWRLAATLAVGLGGALLAAPALAASYTITNLGVLPGGYSESDGNALSANGQVAGTAAGDYDRAFRWTSGGGMQDLGTLVVGNATAYSEGNGINSAGQVVGYASYKSGTVWHDRAFLYTPGSGMQVLPTLGGSSGYANSINDSGQVVGYAEDAFHHLRPFLWTATGGIQDLGALPGRNSGNANAINASGQVVGGSYSTTGGGSRAFLWTAAGGMQDLGVGDGSVAFGINASGAVVGGKNNNAFLWTQTGGVQALPGLGGTSSASGINSSGLIVGDVETVPGTSNYVAALWQGGALIDLNTLLPASSGWQLLYATAINDAGQITGTGTYNGEARAFLLNPTDIPEPASAALLGAGLLGLGRFRRRRQRGG
jgi:probable HAF family extracellular repeat protein